MEFTEKTQRQHWVNTWKQAEIVLQAIKQRELQHYVYAEHLALIDEMLQWAVDHAQPRLSSGLVEQQQWFMKLHEQQQRKI